MSDAAFRAPPSADALPRTEQDILRFWQEAGIFAQTLSKDAPRGTWPFYEGPPTANNVPHVGHALTRAIKDLLPRFKTMQGFHVPRKAGWDTHGLPVEISIEKELGFTDKNAIEAYGIEAFNRRCFDSVRRYEREWVTASERLGYWLDYDDAYFTFTNRYVESVWWILGRMFEAGMLYEGHKVLPYCPLCGTTHSSHEVAQAYQDVVDPSVTVAFPLRAGQTAPGAAGPESMDDVWVLAWTTTPWTLPSNLALCVHPEHVYVLVASSAFPGRRYLIARDITLPVEEVVDGKPIDLRTQPPLASFAGADLQGLAYAPLFDFTGEGAIADPRPDGDRHWTVVADPYVTLDSGTGVVHVAPGFGEDDHRVGQRVGLSLYVAIHPDGRFKEHTGALAGLWFKDGDEVVLRALKARGQLVRNLKESHSYPHCWRHDTPLYYAATSSWFVRTTALRDAMIAGNATIRWQPDHVRDGRFGRWLEGVVDWALSRKRYWGTPLPIWRCGDCGATECIPSYARLFERAGRPLPDDPYDQAQWNPHRPYVDDLRLPCGCGGSMQRVPEVIDCWFDAGAMPFAQHHYPFDRAMAERIDRGELFPARFISEAVDQTRGWFYTLHVIATFLKGGPAYQSCVVLGHVLDEQGKKMSKRLGNVVQPGEIIDRFGADAFRWFFYRSNPTLPSRFGPNMVRDSLKSLLLPLLNAWSFFTIYAEIDGFRPVGPAPTGRAPLDRWVLGRLARTIEAVTDHLDGLRIDAAARAIEEFVEGLTNWYIRRSRDRFWSGAAGDDKAAAHWTLYEVLSTLRLLLAPFMPFLAERLHQDLVRAFDPSAPASVHLCAWPTPQPVDEQVLARMDAARRVASLGHGARQEAGLGVRQPLRRATVVTVDPAVEEALADAATAAIIADELNVHGLALAHDRAAWVDYQVKPNFRALGKRLGPRMKAAQAAVAALDPASTVAAWERDGRLTVDLPDGPLELAGDDLEVRLQQKEGTASAFDDALLVALDTVLDDALVAEGIAREVVNRVSGLRKDRDLAYDARIEVTWDGGEGVAAAVEAHRSHIAAELLAVALRRNPGHDGEVTSDIRGERFTCSLRTVPA